MVVEFEDVEDDGVAIADGVVDDDAGIDDDDPAVPLAGFKEATYRRALKL